MEGTKEKNRKIQMKFSIEGGRKRAARNHIKHGNHSEVSELGHLGANVGDRRGLNCMLRVASDPTEPGNTFRES
jgi:hypothetical protein